jgi:hypothetical protein
MVYMGYISQDVYLGSRICHSNELGKILYVADVVRLPVSSVIYLFLFGCQMPFFLS